MRIVWSPLALERLTEIAAYIAQDDAKAAENWVEKVFSTVDGLRRYPEIGRVVPELGLNEFREIIFGNYRIIYRREAEIVSVLTVRHSKQILPIDEITSDIL